MSLSFQIIGAGGHAKVVRDCAVKCNYFTIKHFDENLQHETLMEPFGLVKHCDEISDNSPVIVAIGDNNIRKKLYYKYRSKKNSTLIHPSSLIADSAVISDGTVILAGSIVSPYAKLGTGIIINSGAIIEHDCQLDEFCHIAPGAILAGNVHVGAGTWVGMGAKIIQGVTIGCYAIIGAGAVVLKDVPDGAIVKGIPGRIKNYVKTVR